MSQHRTVKVIAIESAFTGLTTYRVRVATRPIAGTFDTFDAAVAAGNTAFEAQRAR